MCEEAHHLIWDCPPLSCATCFVCMVCLRISVFQGFICDDLKLAEGLWMEIRAASVPDESDGEVLVMTWMVGY